MSILFIAFSAALAVPAFAVGCGKYSEQDKDLILQVHNTMRSKIAKGTYTAKGQTLPSATNMAKLTWDCDLAQASQQWADRCVFEHSPANGAYGENLYYYSNWQQIPIANTGKNASDLWEHEYEQYGFPGVNIGNIFNYNIGHATQMSWAKTTKIGCGVGSCQQGKQVIVVCRYKVAGNYLNQNIYNPGPTCSECSSCDTSTGLCA